MVDRYELANLAMRVVNAEPRRRAALIDEATAGRPELREAVTRLIDGASSGLEDDPLAELGRIFKLAVMDERGVDGADDPDGAGDPFDQSGTTIDRYRLIHRLGAGASGAVYLAEQESPVKRRVALKLVHHGAGTPRLRQRFRMEQRVLASLDHPGIARLIDAGDAPDGRPYIVMELIDGPGILAYCRQQALPLRPRVRLLTTVCDAVQHAHGRGVIHRDLKPGNIVMRVRDGAAEPVVVDFGVARLLDPDPELALTSLGQPIGTRRYMSPEQRAGETVDARSDVWSLGVTIAEVLDATAAPADGLDEKPKSAAGSDRQPDTASASPRGGRLPSSASTLPRELRWIVDRCCAREPKERYQAAAELGADLRRYLSSEPVSAAPPSLFYRTGRLLARHPVRTALAALVLLAIVGAAAYAEFARARLAQEVEAQRDLIAGTIDDVIDEIWVFMGSEATREKLLTRLLARTDALLRLDPDEADLLLTKARLLRAVGDVSADRSDSAEMVRVCREALDIYDRLAPGREGDVEFVRAHAEALIRAGDSMAVNTGGVGDTRNQPLDEVGAHYARARRMQLDALARFPGHVGLRDDLCWSLIRALPYEEGAQRDRAIRESIRFAEELLADTPERDLSKFALCTAHLHAGMHRKAPDQAPTPGNAIETHRHFTEAVRLSRELVRSQPRRAAFVRTHIDALTALVSLNLFVLHAPGDAPRLVDELERFLRGLDLEQWSRADIQVVASASLGVLAQMYAELGRREQVTETICWFEAVSADPAISWTPQGRAVLDLMKESLQGAGLLTDDDAEPSAGSE